MNVRCIPSLIAAVALNAGSGALAADRAELKARLIGHGPVTMKARHSRAEHNSDGLAAVVTIDPRGLRYVVWLGQTGIRIVYEDQRAQVRLMPMTTSKDPYRTGADTAAIATMLTKLIEPGEDDRVTKVAMHSYRIEIRAPNEARMHMTAHLTQTNSVRMIHLVDLDGEHHLLEFQSPATGGTEPTAT